MNKKTYQQPEMKVAELEQTDIICTSSYNEGNLRINGGRNIEMDEEDF